MASLLDISPSFATVKVGDVDVSVSGVTAEGVAYLLHQYPSLRALISGRGVDLSPEGLLQLGPEIVSSIIAVGAGSLGDKEAERVAASLPLATQVAFLKAIMEATLPGGVGPFMESLEGLLGVPLVEETPSPSAAATGKARATKSPKR